MERALATDWRDLKCGTVRAPFVADLIERLAITRRHRFVDVGRLVRSCVVAGRSLSLNIAPGQRHRSDVFLVAMVTGADVVGVEIRPDLHALARALGARVRRDTWNRFRMLHLLFYE